MAGTNTASHGPELSARSIIIGLIVALIIGSAYPYCVLKLGFGPNGHCSLRIADDDHDVPEGELLTSLATSNRRR